MDKKPHCLMLQQWTLLPDAQPFYIASHKNDLEAAMATLQIATAPSSVPNDWGNKYLVIWYAFHDM